MKERPILFSGPMVRAILDGRKTQTRRVIKGEHTNVFWNSIVVNGYGGWTNEHGSPVRCPYGKPGDRLWVRETFSYRDYGDIGSHDLDKSERWYWADGSQPTHGNWTRPKPSIHMPRWASRITLKITDMRVERLQDISHRDALAEGVDYDVSKPDGSPLQRFQQLWESLNGPESWIDNPWVWVVEFKHIEARA